MTETSNKGEYEELIAPQLDALLRTARRLVRDPNEAEDLVQEALLRGFRFLAQFQRGTNFKAWIFKILMNTFVNHYRKRKRQEGSLDPEAEPAADEPANPVEAGPLTGFLEREEAILDLVDDRIKQAVDDLPEQLRVVFMLATIEDLKYREIAEVIDCPVGTVMSRLFRGRNMLKQRLADLAEERGYLPGVSEDEG